MQITRRFVTLLALCALASGAGSQSPSSKADLSGPARGACDLPPAGSGQLGSLSGFLFSVEGSLEIYRFQALLADVPSPCLSCGRGDIRGTLDDGVGPGPDFLVTGHYSGSAFGFGQYEVQVFRPGGTTPVGEIRGRYGDALGDPGLGRFGGRFQIHR